MNSDKTLSTIEIIAIASDKNRPISERATAARSLIGIASERAYCTVERFAQQCGMSRQQLYRLANIYNFAVLLDISWDWIDSIGIAKTAYIMQPDTHKLIASDNGCGMSLEEFRKYYLALGGSKKPPGSLGCFGAAKELTFAMAHWEIRSLDFVCTGQGAADIVSIEQPGRKNGFTVIYDESEKQESARLFNSIQVGKHLAHIMSLSNIPMQIKLNGETVKQGRTLSNLKLLSNSIAGDGRLYVYRGKKFRQNEWPGELYIRVKGLFTAIDHVQSEYCYYLELEQVSNKILSENRDYLLYHVKREVCDVIDKYGWRLCPGLQNKR